MTGASPQAAADCGRLVADGLGHHGAGRLAQAEALYRQALAIDGAQADALHYLGVIALQVGKPGVAVQLISQSLRANGANPGAFSNLGVALRKEGRIDEAAQAYRQALALNPDQVDAANNLVNLQLDQRRFEEAEPLIDRLAGLKASGAADLYLSLSKGLLEAERYADAVRVLERCRAHAPGKADLYSNLGVALRKLERLEDTLAAYRRGLALDPANAGLLNNLAIVLQDLLAFEASGAAFRRAEQVRSDYKEAAVGVANILRITNRIDAAVEASRAGLRRHGDFPDLHFSLGFNLLMRGEYLEGFAEYEWRSRMASFEPKRSFTSPVWNGEPLAGRRLLIHDEQGVGDAFQFLRFVRLLPPDTDCFLECNSQLTRLLQGMPGLPPVVTRSANPPPHDLRVPLVSLPHLFGITLDDLPGPMPYLFADPTLVEDWKRKLPNTGRDLKVGLVWAGSPGFMDDHLRSPRLSAFLPLLDTPGVTFFALQKGPGRVDLERLDRPLPGNVVDLGEAISDFSDTAAILAHLDLLISSCTSPVHLSAGMGRPTWAVLPHAPDWRWMLGREDSPWYPEVRLFRQDATGRVWAPVIERVGTALRDLAAR